jgi:hypothetical protein
MCYDIPVAIQNRCHHLAALGLVTYTELLGGLFRGNLSIGQGKVNFNTFIRNFFGDSYTDLDFRLKKAKLIGLYSVVRSALVHEYFMKQDSIISIDIRTPTKCGITFDPDAPEGKFKIVFAVSQYFLDFGQAFHKYRARVKCEEELAKNVEKALVSIGTSLPRSKPL